MGSSNNGGSGVLVTNVKELYAVNSESHGVFIALKNNGTVQTWGHTSYGGNSSSVDSQLTNVSKILLMKAQ